MGRENAVFSNSGTVWPLPIQPRDPPCFALPGSSEYFLARSSSFAPPFSCFSKSCARFCASVTPFSSTLPSAPGKGDEKGVTDAQNRAQDLLKQLKGGAKLEIGRAHV